MSPNDQDFRNWYDLWMQQTKEFFTTAQDNLKEAFKDPNHFDPKKNAKSINEWLASLKSHWQYMPLNDTQKAYASYWQWMNELCQEASDRLIDEWHKRTRAKQPIHNVQELYELWLNCCNEVYRHAMQSKSYQEAYGQMINATLQFWKKAMPQ